jgi:hypothetical protein
MESKAKFVLVDSPNATDFELHIRASMAQEERRMISTRTSEALRAIKSKVASGERWISKSSGRVVTKLGSPEPRKGSVIGAAKNANGVHPSSVTDVSGPYTGRTLRSLARRKGFEPLTPRFEVWCGPRSPHRTFYSVLPRIAE